VEDAAVLVVADIDGGVEARAGGEVEAAAVLALGGDGDGLAISMWYVSRPGEPELFGVLAVGKTSGSTPMPTRLARWMRSKLSAMTARTPSSSVPLAAQSRELPVPYSLPARMTSGTWSAAVAHRGVVDGHPLAAVVGGDAALDAGDQLVLEPDVGEGAPDHHPVVAAPGAVGVEVDLAGTPLLAQVAAAGRISGMSPAGEMWSVVTESPSSARAAPLTSVIGRGRPADGLEVRRLWM
jgi:hypothetical protein